VSRITVLSRFIYKFWILKIIFLAFSGDLDDILVPKSLVIIMLPTLSIERRNKLYLKWQVSYVYVPNSWLVDFLCSCTSSSISSGSDSTHLLPQIIRSSVVALRLPYWTLDLHGRIAWQVRSHSVLKSITPSVSVPSDHLWMKDIGVASFLCQICYYHIKWTVNEVDAADFVERSKQISYNHVQFFGRAASQKCYLQSKVIC
jgi:hypothetical protein